MNKIQARERKGFLSQGGVLRISSDMKEFFFFWGGGGLKFSLLGLFGGLVNFGKHCLGQLDLSRNFC